MKTNHDIWYRYRYRYMRYINMRYVIYIYDTWDRCRYRLYRYNTDINVIIEWHLITDDKNETWKQIKEKK